MGLSYRITDKNSPEPKLPSKFNFDKTLASPINKDDRNQMATFAAEGTTIQVLGGYLLSRNRRQEAADLAVLFNKFKDKKLEIEKG